MQQQQQQKSNDEYINCTWLSVVQLHLLMNNDHRDRIYSYGFSDSPHRCHHDFILFPASCLDVSLPFIYCCQRCAHGVLTAKHLCSPVASQCLFLYGNCLIRKVFYFSYVDSWPGSMHRSINSFTSLFMALSCLWLCHGQFVRCIYSCVGRNITSTFFFHIHVVIIPVRAKSVSKYHDMCTGADTQSFARNKKSYANCIDAHSI